MDCRSLSASPKEQGLKRPFADPYSGGSTIAASHGKLEMQVAGQRGAVRPAAPPFDMPAPVPTRLSPNGSDEVRERQPHTAGGLNKASCTDVTGQLLPQLATFENAVVTEAVAQQNTRRP
jgi:hypothetical protein